MWRSIIINCLSNLSIISFNHRNPQTTRQLLLLLLFSSLSYSLLCCSVLDRPYASEFPSFIACFVEILRLDYVVGVGVIVSKLVCVCVCVCIHISHFVHCRVGVVNVRWATHRLGDNCHLNCFVASNGVHLDVFNCFASSLIHYSFVDHIIQNAVVANNRLFGNWILCSSSSTQQRGCQLETTANRSWYSQQPYSNILTSAYHKGIAYMICHKLMSLLFPHFFLSLSSSLHIFFIY